MKAEPPAGLEVSPLSVRRPSAEVDNPDVVIMEEPEESALIPPTADELPSNDSPSRPPVHRLQTLKRKSSASNLIPIVSTSSDAKPAIKFKPKAVVRRSKEEREAQKRIEAERRQQRIAEATAGMCNANLGYNRGLGSIQRGGRGGGSPSARARDEVASGPFGADIVSTPFPARGMARTRGSKQPSSSTTIGKDSTRVKKEPGEATQGTTRTRKKRPAGDLSKSAGGESSRAKAWRPEKIDASSDEESDADPRIDIDKINLVSLLSEDEDDEDPITHRGRASMGGSNRSAWGLRPVRLDREEHVDRAVRVNTEMSSHAKNDQARNEQDKPDESETFATSTEVAVDQIRDESKGKGKEVEFVHDRRLQPGVNNGNAGTDLRVKIEPDDRDASAVALEALGGKNKAKKGRSISSKHPLKGTLQTQEDHQEWDRHQRDIVLLGNELATMGPALEESEGEGFVDEPQDPRHGKLYLFQFPPVTPHLVRPDQAGPLPALEEPAVTVVPENHSSRPSQTKTPAQQSGKGKDEPGIKKESDETANATKDVQAPYLTAVDSQLPGGCAGKLKVHESGRVILDWGGTSLELSRGSDVGFLQDAVVINSLASQEQAKQAWALSQIKGKFVVTPDWEKILD